MAIRITIVLDDNVHKKLRVYQARMIKNSEDAVSFSHVINEVLQRGLKSKN